MSTQGQVVDFLKSLKPGEGGIIPLTPETMAMQTGIGKKALARTLYSLKQAGRIDFEKDTTGREIAGVKVIDLEPRKVGRKSTAGDTKHERMRLTSPKVVSVAPRRRNLINTPNLDAYARAKAQFESIATQWGEWGTAEFHENAIAEEALALRNLLQSTQEEFIAVRQERDEYRHDFEALQARKQAKLAKTVEANGAMVVNGD